MINWVLPGFYSFRNVNQTLLQAMKVYPEISEDNQHQLIWLILVGGVVFGFILSIIAFRPFHREPMRGSVLFTADSAWALQDKVSDWLEDADYIDTIVDVDYEFRTVIKYNEYTQEYSCMIVYEY